MKHDERQKLKTNELVETVEKFAAWVKSHTRLLVSVAVLIVLALGLWWFISYQQRAGLDRAWDALSKAKAPEDYARVVRDYPNTPPVTAIALYYQGAMLEGQGATDRAAGLYKRAMDQPYHPFLTPLARLASAHAALRRGPSNFNEIRDTYNKIVTDPRADAGVRRITADSLRLLVAAEGWHLQPSVRNEPFDMASEQPGQPGQPTSAPTGKSGPTTTRDDHK